MNALISLLCPGLILYWGTRTLWLLTRSDEQVDEALAQDFWWVRRLLLTMQGRQL